MLWVQVPSVAPNPSDLVIVVVVSEFWEPFNDAERKSMRIVTVNIELVIDDNVGVSPEEISDYLNNKLYTDPEFFGDFGPENIIKVRDFD
jgi:hypothetical protein